MGGAGILGGIECADRGVCGKSCASSEVDRPAGVGCGDDSGFVPRRSASCGADGLGTRHVFSEVLAFLAALVSATCFFCFVLRNWESSCILVTPGWQDAKLIAADYWLAGVHPTVWLEQFATPARNDFMQFAYLTYFTYLLVLGRSPCTTGGTGAGTGR